MKKSVSELRGDIAAANKQIDLAKKSGNKRQLNLGRQMRIDAWRELRDAHGMEPPAHIAKALGAPKKKEETEFKKPREEAPKKPQEEIMVFTEEEVFGTKKVAVKSAPKKEEEQKVQVSTAPKVSSPELRSEVRSWLNTFPEYAKLSAKAKEHEKLAQAASKDAQELAAEGIKGERLKKALDKLFVNRHKATETRREMARFIEKHKAGFEDENSYDPQLVQAYSDYANRFSNNTDLKVFDPFTTAEDRLMARVSYDYHRPERTQQAQSAPEKVEVKGKSQLQREFKKRLLRQAEDLLESLDETSSTEQEKNKETIKDLRKAASNPEVGYGEMLALAVGKEDKETMENIEVAFLAETVDALETRVAVASGTKKPVKVATLGGKRKKPVRLARLDKKKKEEEV